LPGAAFRMMSAFSSPSADFLIYSLRNNTPILSPPP
jgi:hypothetical protein